MGVKVEIDRGKSEDDRRVAAKQRVNSASSCLPRSPQHLYYYHLIVLLGSPVLEPHTTSMSDKRRAEIEAKRAKLAELRKARADRQKADAERRTSEVRLPRYNSGLRSDRGQTAGPSTVRRDVDDLVTSLIGTDIGRRTDSRAGSPGPTSVPGTPLLAQSRSLAGVSTLSPSGRLSRQSDAASDRISVGTTFVQSTTGTTDHVVDRCVTSPCPLSCRSWRFSVMTPRIVPDLIDVEEELFELPQKVRQCSSHMSLASDHRACRNV